MKLKYIREGCLMTIGQTILSVYVWVIKEDVLPGFVLWIYIGAMIWTIIALLNIKR